MFDTHCHLTHRRFEGSTAEVVERARAAGLAGCITIGTGVADAAAARALAARYDGFVWCTAGLDPHTAHAVGDRFPSELEALRALLAEGGFCALGEIGLDYHHDLAPRPVQAEQLASQLELAVELDLPVVIHVRDAHDDMVRVLAAHPASRGVIHSFTGGPREAERYLELGWSLAFNGVLTYPSAGPLVDAAREAPLDRVLVETDSPYLAPVPRAGCSASHPPARRRAASTCAAGSATRATRAGSMRISRNGSNGSATSARLSSMHSTRSRWRTDQVQPLVHGSIR
jgi:TatD DNase family protein